MTQDLVFYLYAQKLLMELADEKNNVDLSEARTKIKRMVVPMNLFPVLFKEMERMGLIRRVDRYKVEIVNCRRCELLEQTTKLYEENGVF